MARNAETDSEALLLIGKTGHGKSSTGNSILGRDGAFETSNDAKSMTQLVKASEFFRYNGIEYNVIDTPGLCDTEMVEVEGTLFIHEAILKALLMCKNGFRAILLVLKYGERFTAEEKGAIDTLRKIFGGNFIKKHCILVFTNGEQLDIQNKFNDEPLTFEQWLSRDQKELTSLIKECGKERCVLFRNLERSYHDRQREELMKKVEDVETYSHEIFGRFGAQREAFIANLKRTLYDELLLRCMSLLQDSLQNTIKLLGEESLGITVSDSFENLFKNTSNAKQEIEKLNENTKILQQLQNAVESIEREGKPISEGLVEKQNIVRQTEKDKMVQVQKRLKDTIKYCRCRSNVSNEGVALRSVLWTLATIIHSKVFT